LLRKMGHVSRERATQWCRGHKSGLGKGVQAVRARGLRAEGDKCGREQP
jgi:phosphoribosyl-AMP cyclohydrolase